MLKMNLKCPDIPNTFVPQEGRETVEKLNEFIKILGRYGIDSCFGLELRAAYHFEYVNPLPAQDAPQPMRKFFLRTSIEPIMYSYREYADPNKLDHNIVNGMLSSYIGVLVKLRDDEARSGKDDEGGYVAFPPPEHAGQYLERIKANHAKLLCPIQRSAYVFAESILSHPYRDGNGRLGRCLALMCLSHHMMYNFMPIPLGPVLMAHNGRYISALQNLSNNRDWPAFFSEFGWFLDTALDLSFFILKHHPNPPAMGMKPPGTLHSSPVAFQG